MRSTKRTIRALCFALGAAAAMAPGTRPAGACGNAVIHATDQNVRAIKLAEDKLNDGSPAEAAAIVQKTVRDVTEGVVAPGAKRPDQLLLHRALRVFALASVRLDGEFGPSGNAKPEQRKTNVLWSTNILKALSSIKAGDPASKTDYAEALARTKASEAKTMLEDLAAKDLLTTPYAYATLAALRASAGDAKGRDEALARCSTMAAKKSICEVPNARSKPNG